MLFKRNEQINLCLCSIHFNTSTVRSNQFYLSRNCINLTTVEFKSEKLGEITPRNASYILRSDLIRAKVI